MRALICGASGQDGAYLARLLLGQGYEVFGASRDAKVQPFDNLTALGIKDGIRLISLNPVEFRSIIDALEAVEPDEVYSLGGQSSVALSFQQPADTFESIATGTMNLLEALRRMKRPPKLYNAASSECFGNVAPEQPATERTAFRPRSPYAIAKAAAYWIVSNYREAYGLFCSSGCLFNHESELRPARFVSRKIVQTACRIAQGEPCRLRVGDTSIVRDWGYAPEYVEAMWLMLQQQAPADYVIATGESHTLAEFICACFAELDLDWREFTDSDDAFFRATDIHHSYADPSLARDVLGWQARTRMHALVARMVVEEKRRLTPA